ncbi:MAG: carboxypeptidase regulatory-like domain-containing protein [Kofleriaceae bacterium]|nr:carboxypeptidase regulatory-like domain-containing protein [Kofleriaceae bacterium]
MAPREELEREIERLAARLDGAADARSLDELATVRRGLVRPGPRGPGIELPNLRIGFACKQRWEDMVGDDRVRACGGCDRPVFNISAMTRAEAEAVLATRGLTPCVRFYRRPDGTVMTTDCPTGARPAPRRLAVVASSLAAFGAAPAALADPPPAEVTAGTSGAIQGAVTDDKTGERLVGVTVVVTSPALPQTLTAITDEDGTYRVDHIPPGDYTVTFYYADITTERSHIRVGIGQTTPVFQKLNMAAAGGETIRIEMGGIGINDTRTGIRIDNTYTMGLPVPRSFEGVLDAEMGEIVVTEKRPAVEWSVWGRLGVGVASQQPDVVARSVTMPEAGSASTWDAALAADLTFGVARDGDLRLGVWGEVRTSSGPVAGAELVLEGLPPHPYTSRIGGTGSLVVRAGANAHVVTGALGFGYVGSFPRHDPWVRWARHVVGARLVVSVNRSIDQPHDWSATAGLEVEPIGAVHALLDLVTGR